MIIDNCVIILLALWLASVVMQFIRAKKRKRLVRQADRSLLSPHDQEKWRSVEVSFDPMFKDFRKLRIFKKYIEQSPDDFKTEFARYKIFSRAETTVTVSMLLYAVSAFYICN